MKIKKTKRQIDEKEKNICHKSPNKVNPFRKWQGK